MLLAALPVADLHGSSADRRASHTSSLLEAIVPHTKCYRGLYAGLVQLTELIADYGWLVICSDTLGLSIVDEAEGRVRLREI